MATTPTPIAPSPKRKKVVNGTKQEKHSIQLVFTEKYMDLYNQLKSEAIDDDRPLHQYVLRLLYQARYTNQPIS